MINLGQRFTEVHNKIRTHLTQLNQRFSQVNGQPGDILFSNDDGVEFDTLVNLTPMLVEANDVDMAKGFAESFANVFDNWMRISRTTNPTYNTTGDDWSLLANYEETQTWVYDGVGDRITSTINSATYIGFISPKAIDRYTAEVIVSSMSGDDDYIGLCIALAYDEQGRAHTLDVLAAFMGSAPYTVNKDMSVDRQLIAAIRSGLSWSDGSDATTSQPGNTSPGWDSIPDGVKIRVQRDGDIITIDVTNMQDVTTYVPEARTVIDLSSDARLAVFRGPQQWGYVAQSQDQATWDVLQRPVERSTIYVPSTRELHEWQDTDWVMTSNVDVSSILRPGRLYFNTLSEVLTYYDPDELELIPIN